MEETTVPIVRLPRSDLRVSRLAFGTGYLHYLSSASQRVALLRCAMDLGITHFDTAPMYGDGQAENMLGQALRGQRDRLSIGTKFGLRAWRWMGRLERLGWPLRKARGLAARLGLMQWPQAEFHPAAMRRSLAQSLRALRTDYIDILFLHDPVFEHISAWEDLCAALLDVRKAGHVRHLGIAGRHVEPFLPYFDSIFDVVQMPERDWRPEMIFPDFSYGCTQGYVGPRPVQCLAEALRRRPRGAVIWGTTKEAHLRQAIKVVQEAT